MRLRTYVPVVSLVATAVAIGCTGSVPPDEATARHFPNQTPSPLELAEAARTYYPPATADYFRDMDTVAAADGKGLEELKLTPNQIKGRNAWVMWGGGNEAFWDWLARHSYGAIDLLKLIDSNERGKRFARRGVVTEPNTRSPTDKETQTAYGVRYDRPVEQVHVEYLTRTDREEVRKPPDPYVYGSSSGVVGLRLFPNPEFTGAAARRWNPELYYSDTPEGRRYASRPDTIRPYRVAMSCGFCHIAPHPLNPPASPENPEWKNLSNNIGNQYMRFRTVFGGNLKPDNLLYHVLDAQHPGTIDTSLVAADNINNPNTVNSFFGLPGRLRRAEFNPKETIGPDPLDYLRTAVSPGFANPHRVPRVLLDGADSLGVEMALTRVYLNIGLYHQQWVRLHNPLLGFRAPEPFKVKTATDHSMYWHATELRIGPLADFFTVSTNPMRLRDAAGFSGEDRKTHLRGDGYPWNPEYAAGRAAFARGCVGCHSSVQPGDSPELEKRVQVIAYRVTDAVLEGLRAKKVPDPVLAKLAPLKDRQRNLAEFERALAPLLTPEERAGVQGALFELAKVDLLPADRSALRLRMEDLRELTRGSGRLPPDYEAWAKAAMAQKEFWVAPDKDGKEVHNYLSIDVRVPVTITHTNSARASATNGMRNSIWEDYSSTTYQALDSVGRVQYKDPFSGAQRSFELPGGGPGYYRVPTLIAIWATAPFLHNNALGTFNNDPSVKGRLAAFDDAAGRLLWPERRKVPTRIWMWQVDQDPGWTDGGTAEQLEDDGGWVWRTGPETWLQFEGHHIPTLIAGLTGWTPESVAVIPWAPSALFAFLGAGLLLVQQLAAARKRAENRVPGVRWLFGPLRWAASFSSLVLALIAGYAIWFKFWYLIELLGVAVHQTALWIGLQASSVPLLFLAVAVLFGYSRFGDLGRRLTRITGALCLVWAVVLALGLGRFLAGCGSDVRFGPFPAGIPVNALANMHPEPPPEVGHEAREAVLKFVRNYNRAAPGNKPGRAEFESRVGPALIRASKCPDFVTDRGHDYEFMRGFTDQEKNDLVLLLKSF